MYFHLVYLQWFYYSREKGFSCSPKTNYMLSDSDNDMF